MNRSRTALDLISLALTILPGGLALAAGFAWLSLWDFHATAAVALPIVVPAAFLLVVFAARRSLPPLRAGLHPAGLNPGFLAWYCHVALARSASVFALQPLLQCTYLGRYLYWRALGAQVAYGVNASYTVELVDAPLITIGEGTTLADHVKVSAHLFLGEKLYIAPVRIGRDCFLGAESQVGPKALLSDGARLGPGEQVLRKTVSRAAG